ncbi:MAG: hypothetical protein J6Y89_02315 [Lachnospiraceae bacterium]|nr:hypothetical protein [Lachnospiraceae bacterium]
MKKSFMKFLAIFMAAALVIASGSKIPVRAEAAECAYIDGQTPSYSYTVGSDVNVITANITFSPADGDAFSLNDWCGYGVTVNHVDGSKSYYQFGGAQVSWGWDADGDEKEDSYGVNGGTWLGNADTETLTATLGIPAEQGAVVDFIVTSWDSYAGKQFTVDITEGGNATVSGGVAYVDGQTPGSTYTVASDCNSVLVDVEYLAADGDAFSYNDWCANGVAVTHPDGSKSYYQWGGAQVSWGWDADGDGNEDVSDGVNGKNWAGTIDSTTLRGTLMVPAGQGDVLDIIALGWDSYAGTQFVIRHYTESGVVVGEVSEATLSINNGDWSDTGAVIATAPVKGNGSYLVSAELPAPLGSGQFECLTLPNGEVIFGTTYTVTIDKIFINGEEIALQGTSYTCSADGGAVDTRVNIYNEWNNPDFESVNGKGYVDNRTAGDASTATARLITPEQVAALQTIDVYFTVAGAFENLQGANEPAGSNAGPVDLDGTYNAYLCFQTPTYSFRNNFDEPSYGRGVIADDGTEYFMQVTGWDADDNAITRAGEFKDAIIAGNGTYTVSVDGLDLKGDFDSQDHMNMIMLSTDIPNTEEIVISDISLKVDGKTVALGEDSQKLNKESVNYMQIQLESTYSKGDNAQIGAYNVPMTSMEITFTVSGFNYDKAPEAPAEAATDDTAKSETTEAAPTQAPTEAPKAAETTPAAPAQTTGDDTTTEKKSNVGLIVGICIGAVALAGVGVFVATRKKK